MFPLLIATCVNLIALGIILPILPFYVTEFDPSPEVAALIFSVFSGASLLTAPLWGRLSDHIGRKPVLLISVAGTCASYIWLANADALWEVFASRAFHVCFVIRFPLWLISIVHALKYSREIKK